MLKLPPRSKKIQWGIAGAGQFSENAVIPALQHVRRAKINAVFSHHRARAKSLAEKFAIPNYFTDFQAFLSSDIDAVYIGSANVHHYEQVLQAAEAKKHILCDKPLSLTSKQAEEMVEVCRKNKVFFTVNYPYRFHPLIQKAKELIQNKTIGKFISIDAHFNINFVPNDNFRFIRSASGGGALRDLGTHIIDAFRYLNGELEPVSAVLDNLIYKSEVEDFASGIVRFRSGGIGYFNVSYNAQRGMNRIDILGHKGTISIENMVNNRLTASKLIIHIEGERRKIFRKRANRLQRLVKSVNTSFLKNQEPEVTGQDGLINMRIMEQLEKYVS